MARDNWTKPQVLYEYCRGPFGHFLCAFVRQKR